MLGKHRTRLPNIKPNWGTQESKLEPWRSEAEHATIRSRRLPKILNLYEWAGKKQFASLKLEGQSWVRTRDCVVDDWPTINQHWLNTLLRDGDKSRTISPKARSRSSHEMLTPHKCPIIRSLFLAWSDLLVKGINQCAPGIMACSQKHQWNNDSGYKHILHHLIL